MTGRLFRGSLHLTISLVDELELRWFYSAPALSFGGCMDAKSSLGAQLEQAERLAWHTVPCKRCRGRGFLCVATGLKRKDQTRMREYMKLLELYEADEKLPPAMDTFCADCNGTGFIARPGRAKAHGPITVHQSQTASPGASSASTNGPDLEMKGRFDRVEGQVERFRKSHRRHEDILETFLTVDATNQAIWAFTEAGHAYFSLPRGERGAREDLREEAEKQAQMELDVVSRSWTAMRAEAHE